MQVFVVSDTCRLEQSSWGDGTAFRGLQLQEVGRLDSKCIEVVVLSNTYSTGRNGVGRGITRPFVAYSYTQVAHGVGGPVPDRKIMQVSEISVTTAWSW